MTLWFLEPKYLAAEILEKSERNFRENRNVLQNYVADCESHDIILYQSQSSALVSASCRLFNLAGFQLISPNGIEEEEAVVRVEGE